MTERRRQLLLLLAGWAFVGLAAISNSIWPLIGLLMLAFLSRVLFRKCEYGWHAWQSMHRLSRWGPTIGDARRCWRCGKEQTWFPHPLYAAGAEGDEVGGRWVDDPTAPSADERQAA